MAIDQEHSLGIVLLRRLKSLERSLLKLERLIGRMHSQVDFLYARQWARSEQEGATGWKPAPVPKEQG